MGLYLSALLRLPTSASRTVLRSFFPTLRGGSLRAELAMSLVLHRTPGIGSPRDFIRFSRCRFWRSPVRSGFERVFAHGRARAAIERPNYLRLSPPWHHFHKKRWQTQIIRSPGHRSACCMPLHSNEARTHRQTPKQEYRSFAYNRRSTDARAAEVPEGGMCLWKPENDPNFREIRQLLTD